MKSLRVAVIGATGLVGRTMLRTLEERGFPVEELLAVASERSVGKKIAFAGGEVEVMGLEAAVAAAPDVALFSAGGETSLEWAPKFAAVGTTVVDNSSAWRMHKDYKLVVPEVNGDQLGPDDLIIANPNCTTMQLVMVLKPLHDNFQIIRGVVSTYQSVTGTGQAAVAQMEDERAGRTPTQQVYPYQIDKNCLPHCDTFQENGYTREEMKVHHETKKIMQDDSISLSCTAVRVPVVGGHGESVFLEFAKDFEISKVRDILSNFPGVVLQDNPEELEYPMPISAHGKDDVFVGRLRRDLANPKGLHLWIVSDNLRKGAATNTIQIAEFLNKENRWG
ncbi:MAG TPA: aspartate-semialdehyde dehydrogenase [Flavobacteriales bacterium]|nr:aspartate-semialdehyde dehydrogenase [Flavobacteriales bacterium]